MVVIYGFILTLFLYLVYKIRFKNFRRFKIYLFRKWIKFQRSKNNKKRSLDSPLSEKCIQIWKLCVKQKNSELLFSYISKSRQVLFEDFYLIFTEDEYERGTIRFYNNKNGCNSYFECYVNKNNFEDVAEYFDLEIEKRMRVIDNSNKNKVLSNMNEIIQNFQK